MASRFCSSGDFFMAKNTAALLANLVETQIETIESEYAENVGRIAIAWNSLHSSLLMGFEQFLDISEESAKNLWEVGTSDRQQRNMLRALANEIENEKLREDYLWTLGKIDSLAEFRNSLIHAPVKTCRETFSILPDELGKANHTRNFKNIKEKDLFSSLEGDILKLSAFILRIFIACNSNEGSSPQRPKLEGLGALIPGTQQKTHSD
jgi:hypothetical protein